MRYLAAWLLAKEDGVSPEDALERVLQAMRDRIGSREGEWLNSLALLGQRFDGETCEGDRFYAAGVSAADITKQLGIGRSDARRDDDDVVHASSTSSPCRRVGQPE